ncbi:MAG: endopeptidase La, partial [Candidatus Onthovivens sp.]|nr:endopeptidase La [Candidatus Onthovivens sp.]
MTFNPGENITLPVLVCKGFVTFPDSNSAIYVERIFSKAALTISQGNFESYILVLTQKDNNQDANFSAENVYDVGTLCRINAVNGTESIRIRLFGLERIKLNSLRFDEKANSYFAEFQVMPDLLGDEKKERVLVETLLNSIEKNREILLNSQQSITLSKQVSSGLSALKLSYYISNLLDFSTESKIELLSTKDVNERLEKLIVGIDELKMDAKIENEIQQEIAKSTQKNQREYILREKMRIIKQELGEGNDENDNDALLEKIQKEPYPAYIKNKIKDEIKRYNMMPQASLEASLIKNYIDLLVSIPWFEKTEDNDDLTNVQKILDEDHYALTKVKERIIEYLAIKKMTGNLKAPILCFYGPPGVGKTSLAKSIARALGRKFVKSSLGGVSDESEIRGHRRTYVGSMPGRIIQGMRKAKSMNPVFLLDEIDKVASSYKGDPASALLEVLDPEQNIQFNDNYVEEPFDLSNVLFIATANDISNIPGPLRDRLELIEVSSYTVTEKLHIAKEHLVPKQLKLAGLDINDVKFEDKAILSIIYKYTREAGVRSLERKIASICRKIVVELLNGKKSKKVLVTEKKVREYLGLEPFPEEKKEDLDQIGVVNGLAYTQYGG